MDSYQDWEKHRDRARGRRSAGRGAKFSLGERERRRLAQLGVCIALFLVVFVGKGVFPDQMLAVRDKLTEVISGDTDFREAFANLGRSISEGEPVLDTLGGLWVDVFGGEPVKAEEPETALAELEIYQNTKGELLQPMTAAAVVSLGERMGVKIPSPPAELVPEPEPVLSEEPAPPTETVPSQEETPSVVHVDYSGPALPDNATMDQYDLGLGETVTPAMGWVSSSYGWREHPVDGGEKFHNGVDLAVVDGTDVKVFADGTVDYIGDSPIYGLYTQISHTNGVTSFYAHCSQLLVQQGQTVQRGDVIAKSGETGNATGPHLHFELKKDGVLLNPLYYIETE